ncbi:MAG: hydrogenase/urease maturation nickel metallochaperone HypA [Actinomycetota bacterium]
MHEHGIVKAALLTALEAAEAQGAQLVTGMDVVVEDPAISEDAVRMYLDELAKGTIAEGAEVRLRRQQATWSCWDCGAVTHGDGMCAMCGSHLVERASGPACRIERVDVEEASSSLAPSTS